VYRKLQNKPDSEAETLASSSMSFTYHPIPRRAKLRFLRKSQEISSPALLGLWLKMHHKLQK
jgi:hypothetical protein